MTCAVGHARESDVAAVDGRNLHTYEAGKPDGELVVIHHGTPCSGLLARSWVADAMDRGIRLVSYDRPGYGGSQRHRGSKVVTPRSPARPGYRSG